LEWGAHCIGVVHIDSGYFWISIWESGTPAAKTLGPETCGLLYINVDAHFRENYVLERYTTYSNNNGY